MANIVHNQVHSLQPIQWAHTVLASSDAGQFQLLITLRCVHASVNKELL